MGVWGSDNRKWRVFEGDCEDPMGSLDCWEGERGAGKQQGHRPLQGAELWWCSHLGQHGQVLVLHNGGPVGGQAALLQAGEQVVQVHTVGRVNTHTHSSQTLWR